LDRSHFAVLIKHSYSENRRDPRHLPSENFFLISTKEFVLFFNQQRSTTKLCYNLMLSVLNKEAEIEQVIVHQIGHPNVSFFKKNTPAVSAEIIIPHRGNLEDLETALQYVTKQRAKPSKVSVCFDELVADQHFYISDKYQHTDFYLNYPTGIGPYPSRDALARSTQEDIIIFHDSDDISTFDRVGKLTTHLIENNLDAVGSHELRVDTIQEKIVAKRYPLKVIEAAREGRGPGIFFPTSAIKKSSYLKNGGLSTVRRHSSDTQFYKRAYFFLNIENVDEFLYIRVKHENSLTTAKSTALGTPVRERIRKQWLKDFVEVQHQSISLFESTLIDEHVSGAVNIVSLDSNRRSEILKWQQLCHELRSERLSVKIKGAGFPDEKDLLEERILKEEDFSNYSTYLLKQSTSWRIAWAITMFIRATVRWVPFIRR